MVGRQGERVAAVDFDAVACSQERTFGDVEKIDDAVVVEIDVAVEQVVVEDVVVLLRRFAPKGYSVVFIFAENQKAEARKLQAFQRMED